MTRPARQRLKRSLETPKILVSPPKMTFMRKTIIMTTRSPSHWGMCNALARPRSRIEEDGRNGRNHASCTAVKPSA
jgi:hypothetical protein